MIGRECSAEADMGVHGEAYVVMVSYLAANGELAEDNTHGAIAGNHCGY